MEPNDEIVYTCGLCEEICKKFEGHPCLKDFGQKIFIDDNHYFYPLLDDDVSIVRRCLMPLLLLFFRTGTNVTKEVEVNSEDETGLFDGSIDEDIDDSGNRAALPIKRQRTRSTKDAAENLNALHRIADAMCKEQPQIVLPPAPPQPDEVESILHAVGLQLRKLPYPKKMSTLIEISQLVHSKYMDEISNL